MRAALLGLLLLAAPLTGCIQQGEEIDSSGLDDGPDQEADEEGTSSQTGNETDGSSAGGTNGTSGSSDQDPGTNQTGSTGSQDGGDGDGTSDTPSGPQPWNRTVEARLGLEAGVGFGWAPAPVGTSLGNFGVVSDTRCTRANVTVPSSTGLLSITLSGEAFDPDELGAGGYEVEVRTPAGNEVAALGGPEAMLPGEAAGNWSTRSPAKGNWSLTAQAVGPVVHQTWDVTITLEGKAVNAPESIPFELTC